MDPKYSMLPAPSERNCPGASPRVTAVRSASMRICDVRCAASGPCWNEIHAPERRGNQRHETRRLEERTMPMPQACAAAISLS